MPDAGVLGQLHQELTHGLKAIARYQMLLEEASFTPDRDVLQEIIEEKKRHVEKMNGLRSKLEHHWMEGPKTIERAYFFRWE